MFKLGMLILSCAVAHSASADCFADAATRYDIDEHILRAIAKVESDGNPKAYHVNSDGSHDIGLMQINSSHLAELKKFNITETSLYDACTSVAVGAWILADNFRQYGKVWRAVGVYNTGPNPKLEKLRVAYADKVLRAITQPADRRQSSKPTTTVSSRPSFVVIE